MTSAARSFGDTRAATEILTFLIADVRGYTSFTQQHGDEAAARLAATFAEIAREGVEARGGRVIELRGDEALAVFTSARQLRAAVDLQVVFKDETDWDPATPLRVGMGIDAGEAVPVEDGYRGAALNFAARLCSQAGPFEVLATQGVIHLARAVDGVRVAEHGPLQLKGVAAPVTVLRVLRDDDAGERSVVAGRTVAHAVRELPPELHPDVPVLAGRDADLRWLRWHWRLARRGLGRVVLVTGPTGVGKTRLLSELASEVHAAGAEVVYLRGTESPEFDAIDTQDATAARLVVVDDAELLSREAIAALSGLARRLAGRWTLVAVTALDEAATGLRASQLEYGCHRTLRPLGPADVRALAAVYMSGLVGEVPAVEIVRDIGGMPAAVLRELAAWAGREATRRLGEAAGRAAVGRSGLRVAEAELAGSVIELQLAREQEQLTGGYVTRDPERPPFKGLASFDLEDADVFFGRERLAADMVARLAGSSLLGVVGPSGSGKSSAVRAGLVPALGNGVLPTSDRWLRAVLRPSSYPLRELDRAVWAAMPEELSARLAGRELPLRAVRQVLRPGERVLWSLTSSRSCSLAAPTRTSGPRSSGR